MRAPVYGSEIYGIYVYKIYREDAMLSYETAVCHDTLNSFLGTKETTKYLNLALTCKAAFWGSVMPQAII